MKKALKQIGLFFIWLYLIASILFNTLFIVFKIEQPQDFGSFIQAGLNVATGKNPYDSNGDLIFRVIIDSVGLDVASPNLNPPISVVIFEALAKLGTPEMLSMIWRLISMGMYAFCVLFLEKWFSRSYSEISPRRHQDTKALSFLEKLRAFVPSWLMGLGPPPKGTMALRLFWAFTLAGFWHTIEVGQIYIPLVMAFCIAWVFAKQGKHVAAGILLGLILSVKPNFFILILLLIVAKYFRLAFISILTFLVISILPFFVYGPNIYYQWFEATASYNGYALPNNSFVGLMVRFQHQEWGTLLSIALVIFLLIFAWRKKLDTEILWGLGVSASLFCSPIAWDGYTLFLLPYLYSQRNWLTVEKVGAAILTIPFVIPYLLFQQSWVNFVLFGWTYGWGILLILIAQIKKSWDTQPVPSNSFLQNK